MVECVRFFLQAEDGIRDLVRSRGLGDVYKRQAHDIDEGVEVPTPRQVEACARRERRVDHGDRRVGCLLYTSDAADDLPRVDLGGRRSIKKKNEPATV